MKTKKIILIVFAIFSGIVTFSQNLEEGQVSYYPFSGNADDASGNGYNGLITGGTFMNNDTELDISGIDYLADASETTTL
ncbi:MAG: hypothetical protein K8S16_04100, partial [Bacteroidales bacterium]|nr:hypothetical protein [Bacteroidales bacterium]